MRSLALASILASLAACSTIIGIEDRPLGDPRAVSEAGPLAAITGDSAIDSPPFGAARLEAPGCEVSPRKSATVLDERCGVFVAASGNDTNPGTRALPLRTLAAGRALAVDKKVHRVFVCGTTFAERIEMSAVGVSMVGGLTCDGATWGVGTEPTLVAPPEGDPQPHAPVVRITGVPNAIVLEGFRFETRSATANSESSNPVFLSGAASVSFVRTTIAAGAGAKGTAGMNGDLATGGGTNGNLAGSGGSAVSAAAEVTCACKVNDLSVGTSKGGGGGSSGNAPTGGAPESDAGGAAGANGMPCVAGGNGVAGAAGTTSAASTSPGLLTELGWAPARGGDGTAGSIGQGGGGGGAFGPYAGGGGGCGGCPSTGATGGAGGGGSIAIAAVSSGVALFESTLITSDGGSGGKGGASPNGQPGGVGQGNVYGKGCTGGNGGAGGKGGDGVGGAGGVSVGILLARSPEPLVDTSSESGFRIGVAGMAGPGASPGPSGVSAKIFQSM